MKKTLLLLAALCCAAMSGIFTSCEKEKEVVEDIEKEIVNVVENVESATLPAQIYKMTYGKTRSEATLALLDAGYTIDLSVAAPARMPMRLKSYDFEKTLSNGDLEYISLIPDDSDTIISCLVGFSYKTLPNQKDYNAKALSWCEFAKKSVANPAYMLLALQRDYEESQYLSTKFIEQKKQELQSDYKDGNISDADYQEALKILNATLPEEQFYVDLLTNIKEQKQFSCGYAEDDTHAYFVQGKYDIYESQFAAVIICQMGVIN